MLELTNEAVVPTIHLSGPEKAAALMLLAGQENAVKLADFFSEEELREIFTAAGNVGSLSIEEVESLVEEFQEQFVKSGLIKSHDSVETLFEGIRPGMSLAEFVTGVKEEIPVEIGPSTWQEIAEGGIEPILQFVQEEHPQASAFLLSQIDQAIVAQVLEALPGDLLNVVVLRLVDIARRPGSISEEMERLIVARFRRTDDNENNTEALEKIANVINELSREQADDIVAFLEKSDADKAAQIRRWLFRFELVEGMGQQDRAILFDGVPAEEMAQALFGAGDGLKEAVLGVLSQRNRRSVESEMGDANYAEQVVMAAQRKLARQAVALSREGRISLTPEGAANG